MKDMSDCNKNNNQDVNLKEEKLFRAMSGVDEDLLLRSEQIRNSGRVHKFPMRYVTRIAAYSVDGHPCTHNRCFFRWLEMY